MHQIKNKKFSDIKVEGIKMSVREGECIYYLLRGMTARQIAEKIHRSRRTVEGHLLNIKNKLNCSKKSELISKVWDSEFPFAEISQREI